MPQVSGKMWSQFGSSALRQFINSLVVLFLLAGVTACTDSPKPQTPNKLQESERRFWRHDYSEPKSKSTPTTAAAPREDSPAIDLEDAPVPREVTEKIEAELDIACGAQHPTAADVTKLEPVQITPDGEKALLLKVTASCICGATGNCPREVWTRDQNGRYAQALAEQGYEMLLANTVHNDHYDVITESYLSARESAVLRYEWDGKTYRPAEQSCRVGDGEVATRPIVPGRCR